MNFFSPVTSFSGKFGSIVDSHLQPVFHVLHPAPAWSTSSSWSRNSTDDDYGCKSWSWMNKKVLEKIQSLEMSRFRKILRISWIQKRTNDSVLAGISNDLELVPNVKASICSYRPNQGEHQSFLCFYRKSLILPQLVKFIHDISGFTQSTLYISFTITTSWDDCAQRDKGVNLLQYFIHDFNVDWFWCGSHDFHFLSIYPNAVSFCHRN